MYRSVGQLEHIIDIHVPTETSNPLGLHQKAIFHLDNIESCMNRLQSEIQRLESSFSDNDLYDGECSFDLEGAWLTE
jgi:hypothetical protein